MRGPLGIYIAFAAALAAAGPAAVRADVAPTQRNYVMRARPGVSITDGVLSESQLYDGPTQISLSYFDGLGRPIGQCEMGAGGAGEDIFTFVEYDRSASLAARPD